MVTKEQRKRIAEVAKYRCGYCLMQEVISGIPLTVEHITPKAKGGQDEDANLWLSCRLCNEKKSMMTEATDPLTGNIVFLFNPRQQIWSEHFAWNEEGTQVLGITETGRATVEALALNSELRVRSRAIWVKAGYHPPD